MTQRIQNSPQYETAISPTRLSQYLGVIFILFSGLTFVTFAAKGLGQSAALPPNLFSSFEDIFPGKPATAATGHGLFCTIREYAPELSSDYCTLSPVDGPVSQVTVVIDREVIHSISFRLREGALTLGDLSVLWGLPVVQKYDDTVYCFWQDRGNFALVEEYHGQYSMFLPVLRVTIVDASLLAYP